MLRELLNVENYMFVFIPPLKYEANPERYQTTPVLEWNGLKYVMCIVEDTKNGHLLAHLPKAKYETLDVIDTHAVIEMNTSRDVRVSPLYESMVAMWAEMQPPNHWHRDKLDADTYILTTSNGQYGAGLMMCEEILHQLYEKFECNYYVLPSSIHEVMLIPTSCHISEVDIVDIQIAATTSFKMDTPDEYLTDKVFLYDGETKTLKEVTTCQ